MTWEEFASRIRTFQVGFVGEPNELRPGSGEFHENPTSCICQNTKLGLKTGGVSNPKSQTHDDHQGNKTNNRTGEQPTEEERVWSEIDYDLDSRKQIQFKGTKTDSLPLLIGTDQAELQEFFSD